MSIDIYIYIDKAFVLNSKRTGAYYSYDGIARNTPLARVTSQRDHFPSASRKLALPTKWVCKELQEAATNAWKTSKQTQGTAWKTQTCRTGGKVGGKAVSFLNVGLAKYIVGTVPQM
jgi:hypothetical protein